MLKQIIFLIFIWKTQFKKKKHSFIFLWAGKINCWGSFLKQKLSLQKQVLWISHPSLILYSEKGVAKPECIWKFLLFLYFVLYYGSNSPLASEVMLLVKSFKCLIHCLKQQHCPVTGSSTSRDTSSGRSLTTSTTTNFPRWPPSSQPFSTRTHPAAVTPLCLPLSSPMQGRLALPLLILQPCMSGVIWCLVFIVTAIITLHAGPSTNTFCSLWDHWLILKITEIDVDIFTR